MKKKYPTHTFTQNHKFIRCTEVPNLNFVYSEGFWVSVWQFGRSWAICHQHQRHQTISSQAQVTQVPANIFLNYLRIPLLELDGFEPGYQSFYAADTDGKILGFGRIVTLWLETLQPIQNLVYILFCVQPKHYCFKDIFGNFFLTIFLTYSNSTHLHFE